MATDPTAPLPIVLNGEPRELPPATTIRQLLAALKLPSDRIAVELNRELLPRAEFDRALSAGDRVEVVSFVGGG